MKTVLVTGSNRGIGKAISEGLAASGWKVYAGSRTPADREAFSFEGSGQIIPVILDVLNETQINELVARIEGEDGSLAALVNNAAILIDDGVSVLSNEAEPLIRQTLETNFYAPLRLLQKLRPLLEKAGGARVVQLSSGLGQLEDMGDGYPGYGLSKLILNGLTRKAAAVLRDSGVAVNSMCPGWVRTEMGGAEAPLTVEQGADTAIWLLNEAPQGATGGFYRNRQIIPW
ncbi:MAG: SDR family NAD(P)-dependent oxidoreductase [Puniceicoccaceae bacterium]